MSWADDVSSLIAIMSVPVECTKHLLQHDLERETKDKVESLFGDIDDTLYVSEAYPELTTRYILKSI